MSNSRPERGLLPNAGAALVGTAVFALGQWGVVVVLARLATAEDVGRYSIALAIATPLLMLAGLSLRTVLVTDRHGPESMRVYVGLRAGLLVVSLVLLLAIAPTRPTLGSVLVVVGVAKALDAVADIYFGIHQRAHDLRPMALSLVVNGLMTPVAVGVLLHMGSSPADALWGSAVVSAIAAWVPVHVAARRARAHWTEYPTARQLLPEWDLGSMRSLAITSLPLGVASFVTALVANTPRYALELQRSSEELGVFTAISYVTMAGLTVVSATAQALLPRLVREAENDRSHLRRLALRGTWWIVAATAPVCLLAWLVGAPLLGALYGEEYALTAPLVVLVLALGLSAASWFVDTVMAASRQFRAQMLASAATLVVAIPVAFVLASTRGVLGAAVATAVAAGVQLVARLLLMYRLRTVVSR